MGTISVCDNHTEQRGFIRRKTGSPSIESTSARLHDYPNRFSTGLFFFPFPAAEKKTGAEGVDAEILLLQGDKQR